MAFLSRDLGRIVTDVPGVELNIAAGKTRDFDLIEVANLIGDFEAGDLLLEGEESADPPRDLKQAVQALERTWIRDASPGGASST